MQSTDSLKWKFRKFDKSCNSFQFESFCSCACTDSNCDLKGTVDEICDKVTGVCLCAEGYGGPRCDQCLPTYYNYPDCVQCNCSTVGSTQMVCDQNGKCPCMTSFAGKQCTQCSAGYYQFPECLRKFDVLYGFHRCKYSSDDWIDQLKFFRLLSTIIACNCESYGSDGVSCNAEGQCLCHENFDSKTCNTCKEGYYNYPLCEVSITFYCS